METRKEQLLTLVIENYIATAEPIGSKFLSEHTGLDVSGATIRNELRDLEEGGFLSHPHTSAGRVPTEAGYRYYVGHLMTPGVVSKKIKEILLAALKEKHTEEPVKMVGKRIAIEVNNAVIISFDRSRVFYTGISYLFSQPEFHDAQMTVSVSSIFDHCEERIDDVYDAIGEGETKALVGEQNPFGRSCGMVGTRVGKIMFTVLGPLRMDYKKTYGLVDFVGRETLA